MSERLLTVAIVLFVLSMVCERVANFLKLGLSDTVWFRVFNFKNLRRAETDTECEKQRELGILRLNIVCGFLVAVCFGADFNFILGHAGDVAVAADASGTSSNSLALLGNYLWKAAPGSNSAENTLLSRLMGTLLVAFFISFGSKFWHDLVDLLLETKNLRGKLSDQVTFRVESAKQLDDYLQLREGDMVEAVFRRQAEQLQQLPGVRGVGLSSTEQNGVRVPSIAVVVSPGTDPAIIPPLFYDLGGGRAKQLAVQVREGSPVSTTGGLALGPGNRIGNRDTIVNGPGLRPAYGSLCFPVYRQADARRLSPLLLTCYHVLRYGSTPGAHDWRQFVSATPPHDEVLLYDEQRVVGHVVEGLRTDELDVALAEMRPGEAFSTGFGKLDWQVKGARWPNANDPHKTRVRMLGGVSGEQWGVLRERNMKTPINYHDGARDYLMKGLLTASTDKGLPLSKPGDSGSLLLDAEGYALGLVVAADTTHTYAIPFKRILDALHLVL